MLIGPDNGLLPPAADALGGAAEARELTNRDLWLAVTSSTFHGRDIFAPVAAHLAAGDAAFADVGDPIHVDRLTRLPEPAARATDGAIETVVTYVDSFGNVRLAGGPAPARAYVEELLPDVLDGTIDPGRVFDSTVGIGDVPGGYRDMADRRSLKVLVTP